MNDISNKPASAPGNDNPVQTPDLLAKAREYHGLVSLLTQYDSRQYQSEVRRRLVPNMGRLPILLGAAERAFEHVCAGKSWLEALALEFTHHGAQFNLAPVNAFLKWYNGRKQ
jgi:hypothetical protein